MVKLFSIFICIVFLASNCKKTDHSISSSQLVVPSEVSLEVQVATDQSGIVTVTPSAKGVLIYHLYLGKDASESPITIQPNSLYLGNYILTGDYKVRLIAYGAGGVKAGTVSKDINVQVKTNVNNSIVAMLTGSDSSPSSKEWKWEQSVSGHLGVGPEDKPTPEWWSADPNDKVGVGCLYEDIMIFSSDGNGNVKFELKNLGNSYFHKEEVADALGEPQPIDDQCYVYDISGQKSVGFFKPTSGIAGTPNEGFNITGGGFMSYYLGTSAFEILSISDTKLHLRAIQTVGSEKRAWYMKFESSDPKPPTPPTNDFTTLAWSDEFNTNGALDSQKWTYDIGTGSGGWGNGESQYYTNRSDNVKVENGSLKITAKKEAFAGSSYTSARIKTEGLYDFTYGRIEVKAKLPTGLGTWPAIWMLGADFSTVGWPKCGEIDIMEHVGKKQDIIQSALHNEARFGGNVEVGSKKINNASTEFHIYEAEWTSTSIKFYVDKELYYEYKPDPQTTQNYPFKKDFFIILNVAMGGGLGGTIDTNFTESTMEVDYVRVYQ